MFDWLYYLQSCDGLLLNIALVTASLWCFRCIISNLKQTAFIFVKIILNICPGNDNYSFAFLKGGEHDYEPQSYPVPPAATGYWFYFSFYVVSSCSNNVIEFFAVCFKFQIPKRE